MTATASKDRLVTMLFATCVAHGVLILGVSFGGFDFDMPRQAQALEVVLVQNHNQTDVPPERAHYVSEQNLSGSGTTTEEVPAQSKLSTALLTPNAGVEDGDAWQDSLRESTPDSTSLIATRLDTDRALKALLDHSEDPAAQTERAKLLEAEAAVAELTTELADETALHTPQMNELFVSVNTRESKVARYLAMWKRKIEQVGTLNFPSDDLLKGLTGNPTLEVAIRADGELHEVLVRESSNHPRLDQSAMRIVRLASPFEPFPVEVRRDYDVMRFVYVWQFQDGRRGSSILRVAESDT